MDTQQLSDLEIANCSEQPLSPDEISSYMQLFPTWTTDQEGRLVGSFVLSNFMDALTLLVAIGNLAEQNNHHPDLMVFDYKKLGISLFTNSVAALTQKDFVMAAKIITLISTLEKELVNIQAQLE